MLDQFIKLFCNMPLKEDFFKMFKSFASHRSVGEKWGDIVALFALDLSRLQSDSDALVIEKVKILDKYKGQDLATIPILVNILIKLIKLHPRDTLGEIYTELNLTQASNGQFFTPDSIIEMMVRVTMPENDIKKTIEKDGVINVLDCCCGSGAMFMGTIRRMIELGYNPSQILYFDGSDLNRTTALMCFIQLKIWNIRATIRIGDALENKFTEEWISIPHILPI